MRARPFEFGAFGDVGANVGGDRDQEHAEQKRNAPSPTDELGVGKNRPQEQDDGGAKQRTDESACLRPASDRAAPILGCMLDQQGGDPAELAAERESLHEAQEDQQRRRRRADRGVARQQADQHGRGAHQSQGHHQRVASSDAVAEIAEENAAERPRDETDCEGAQGGQQRDERCLLGIEHFAEHEHGNRAEDDEVVPLDHRSGESRGNGAA